MGTDIANVGYPGLVRRIHIKCALVLEADEQVMLVISSHSLDGQTGSDWQRSKRDGNALYGC